MAGDFPQDAGGVADILSNMKALSVLFAGLCTDYAFTPLAGGPSAFERAVAAAAAFPDSGRTVVLGLSPTLAARARAMGSALTVDLSDLPCAEAASFFRGLATLAEGYDHVYLAFADYPCLDAAFARRLYERHVKYAAEYTFAEGYPVGLAPEILAAGLLPILAGLARDSHGPVTRSVLFDAVKKDINSFDLETDIAPVDLRQMRINLACDTKRNFLLCERLESITADNYADVLSAHSAELRTLPAFYNVQVAARCPTACAYCPYPAFCASGKGRSPGKAATECDGFMGVADFSALVARIAAFSDDAVVSLSLWGECAYHPQIVDLVAAVLAHPKLSVLIETTGLDWRPADVDGISSVVAAAALRENGAAPINWIVSLDAIGGACYGELHGVAADASPSAADRLREAIAFLDAIDPLFPGAVWPQLVRMRENEAELEPFYRFWKEKKGRVIVQKHDHFCRTVAERRVADLSPLARAPCWHLKRDLCILLDGTVPFCREDLYANRPLGNALTDDLARIWDANRSAYEQHLAGKYEGLCGACDEYYTYNF